MSRGSQGIGRIYMRSDSRFWWISLSVRGKRHSESSKSIRRKDAEELLKKRIEQFRVAPGVMSRAIVGELLDGYLRDCELRELRSLDSFELSARRVREHLGDVVASFLEPGQVYELQQELRKKYAPAPVNVTLTVFRSALKVSARNGLLARLIEFPRALPMNNARKGFLEQADYLAILEELPEWAKDPFRFAYASGWRRGEVLSLRWTEVDFETRLVRLDPARSKNGEGRTIPFIGEIGDVLKRRHAERILGVPWVFHRCGRPPSGSSFLNHFREAATIAGRPGLIVHDCRRSAIRNLLRMGVREDVAMKMVGWKTRAMMSRYDITVESDLHDAGEMVARYLEQQAAEPRGEVVPFKK